MSFANDQVLSRLKRMNRKGRETVQPYEGVLDEGLIEQQNGEGSELQKRIALAANKQTYGSKQIDTVMNRNNPQLFTVYLIGLHLQQLRSPGTLAQEVIRILKNKCKHLPLS